MAPRKSSEATEVPALRKVLPQRPGNEVAAEQLQEDLRRMGCAGLLTVPWGFREVEMVRELIGEPPNQYHKTLRAHPESWTKKVWRKVYGFRNAGSGLTNRKDDYAKDQFSGRIDAKEGYSIADCKDARARAVLAFLIPVFYPEKPTRVTVTWANTLLGSFQGKREVDWGLLMHDLVVKLLKTLPKAKSTPLSSYLVHLYHQEELLHPEELRSWTAQEKIWSYGDTDSDAESGESEPDQPEPSPTQHSPAKQTPTTRVGVKRKSTPRTPEGEQRGVRARLADAEGMEDPETPCSRIILAVREVQHHIDIRESMLESIGDLVGCSTRSKLVDAVQAALTNSNRIRELEEAEARLTRDKTALLDQLEESKAQAREADKRATASARAIVSVREALALPADVVNKARLFEDRLSREDPLSRNKIIRFLVDEAATMEQTLEEMRTLADNMLLDEDLSPRKGKGKQLSPQQDVGKSPESTRVPEASPDSRSGKLKRKAVVLSDSESDEEEVLPAAPGETSRAQGGVDPEEEAEEPEAARPVFKTPMPRARYKTTPLGTRATPAGGVEASSRDSGQKTRTPSSGNVDTPPFRPLTTPTQSSTPPSSGQSRRLRSQANTPDAADK